MDKIKLKLLFEKLGTLKLLARSRNYSGVVAFNKGYSGDVHDLFSFGLYDEYSVLFDSIRNSILNSFDVNLSEDAKNDELAKADELYNGLKRKLKDDCVI
ncbi:hypothetical protein K9L67_02180 [Candidatus Woesearchaeota archaeon]|nr:hypothetical protein [Candidatus Woesearchaeota archaeon]MCF7901012.1 hypothetical protein [Candidatus Woesearchaeota archaeon]MCF8013272.1 hypothetical protein [Candidatus Woesearchaeota archaeon]